MLNIQKDVSLVQYTTFKIGGSAKFFVEVKNEEEIIEAVKYAKENNLESFILGGGSNLLVSDKGFDGLVIRVRNLELRIRNEIVECGVGINLSKFVLKLAKKNLSGLKWAVGIPGTVGGAVIGNAGAFGGEIKDNLKEVKAFNLESNEIKIYKNNDCKFGYRDSIFKRNYGKTILISVKFKLEKNKKINDRKKIDEIIKKRKEKQPQYLSAGSFFKNPIVENKKIIENFEKDTGLKIKGNKIPVGWLVESIGFKGKQIGGAKVSEKHGNFIINTGDATAEDVIILSSLIKQKVRSKFEIQLEEEIRMVGF